MVHNSEVEQVTVTTRRIIVPVNDRQECLDMINWYNDNMKREHDLLLFVYVVNPTQKLSALHLPVLIGTMIRIPKTHVVAGKAVCRDAMQLAAKHNVKAHSYLYVDTKPQAALTRAVNELEGDIFLLGPQRFSSVYRITPVNQTTKTSRQTTVLQ
ncbi:hypothetical protein EG68_02934 [Paragonimus skrjabini miyazakii]|uniref:Uncharacterized protein n=1 Tax=Paragonimus skrjabini miyazakii TaxID=59628 RepID=A0A8S9Z453_9TREM|nr:hypothetical protein EG68_02934 [Paragonimus skrjabini miyazakii]